MIEPKKTTEAEQFLVYLRALAVDGSKPKNIGGWKTCDRKLLKALLLETGGVVTCMWGGSIYKYEIATKHLGVGVYNVYLFRVFPNKMGPIPK